MGRRRKEGMEEGREGGRERERVRGWKGKSGKIGKKGKREGWKRGWIKRRKKGRDRGWGGLGDVAEGRLEKRENGMERGWEKIKGRGNKMEWQREGEKGIQYIDALWKCTLGCSFNDEYFIPFLFCWELLQKKRNLPNSLPKNLAIENDWDSITPSTSSTGSWPNGNSEAARNKNIQNNYRACFFFSIRKIYMIDR